MAKRTEVHGGVQSAGGQGSLARGTAPCSRSRRGTSCIRTQVSQWKRTASERLARTVRAGCRTRPG